MPLTAPRPRALHRAEDIGSALKGGVNVCQRQLVKEVLGPFVTEFVPNFGREGATPIQRGSNAGLLHRVQAIKLIRHIRHTALQAWLGHKNIQHTVRYTELSPHRFKAFWRRSIGFRAI
jgi:hypothetical protein